MIKNAKVCDREDGMKIETKQNEIKREHIFQAKRFKSMLEDWMDWISMCVCVCGWFTTIDALHSLR